MFLACGSWCAHKGSSPLFDRCRTVLAFSQSIKPTRRVKPVEIGENQNSLTSNGCARANAFFPQRQSLQQEGLLIFENYKACCCDERCGTVESSTTAFIPVAWQCILPSGELWETVKTSRPLLATRHHANFLPPLLTEFPHLLRHLFTRRSRIKLCVGVPQK